MQIPLGPLSRLRLGPLSRIKLGPVARISLGLVSLASCLLLTADLILGVIPDEGSVARQIRKKSSESLAIHSRHSRRATTSRR